MSEWNFNPSKTYATEDNARKALTKHQEALGRRACLDLFIIVGVPGTSRFAPIVTAAVDPGFYALGGFTVTGTRSLPV